MLLHKSTFVAQGEDDVGNNSWISLLTLNFLQRPSWLLWRGKWLVILIIKNPQFGMPWNVADRVSSHVAPTKLGVVYTHPKYNWPEMKTILRFPLRIQVSRFRCLHDIDLSVKILRLSMKSWYDLQKTQDLSLCSPRFIKIRIWWLNLGPLQK